MKPRARRYPTQSAIVLTARGMGRQFTLTNISASGAGLIGEKQLNVGEGVIINHAGRHISATVRWAKQQAAGVAFEREISEEDLSHMIDPAYLPPVHGDAHGSH